MNDATKAPLDINHSHFILVDNGTIGQYGVEIGLRSSLEGEIFQNLKTTSSSSAGMSVIFSYFGFSYQSDA